MLDPRIILAVENALIQVCVDRGVKVDEKRLTRIKNKILKRFKKGEAQDLVFAEETRTLHA